MAPEGIIADVGCGPGHITRFLAERHHQVVGIDISPEMITLARSHSDNTRVRFEVASMLELPVADNSWSGAIALYSIIHLTAAEQAQAFAELARALHATGWLLVSFHIDAPDLSAGAIHRVHTFLGHPVEMDGYFLGPTQ